MAEGNSPQRIPHARHRVTAEDMDALLKTAQGPQLIRGTAVRAFEQALCQACEVPHAIAVDSGSAALLLAVTALGLGPGKFGWTTPISFVATANAIVQTGADVRFLDVDPASRNLNPEVLRTACTAGTQPAAVVVVDHAGVPADLPAIAKLASTHGMGVIEDAAQALGSTYSDPNGTYPCGCCRHSDLAVLSFHPTKTITCGKGGAVLARSEELATRIRSLAQHGFAADPGMPPGVYGMQQVGWNFGMADLPAALGCSQMKRLPEIKQERQALVHCYTDRFQPHAKALGLVPQPWPEGTSPCFNLYVLQSRDEPMRERIRTALTAIDVECLVRHTPIPWEPYYRERHADFPVECPVADHFGRTSLALPLYPGLTESDVDRIVECVLTAARAGSR